MQPLLDQSCSVFHRVLQSALPDNSHTPAKSLKRLHVSPVAVDIPHEFSFPEIFVTSWCGGVAAAFVSMPEAAVDEYSCPVLWEYEVRRAGQFSDMKSIAKPLSEEKRAKGSFWPSVLSANTRHHPAALRCCRSAHDLGGYHVELWSNSRFTHLRGNPT